MSSLTNQKICPTCGLGQLTRTEVCDCGHKFDVDSFKKEQAQAARRQGTNTKKGSSAGIAIAVVLIAIKLILLLVKLSY